MVLGIQKVIFIGSVPSLACGESGKPFCKTSLRTPDQDSNLDIPVFCSLLHCEGSALDQTATEVKVWWLLLSMVLLSVVSEASNKCSGINQPLKYIWGDAMTDPSDCIGPNGEPYPACLITRPCILCDSRQTWGGESQMRDTLFPYKRLVGRQSWAPIKERQEVQRILPPQFEQSKEACEQRFGYLEKKSDHLEMINLVVLEKSCDMLDPSTNRKPAFTTSGCQEFSY
uniref:Uncharacterized protein n=1 Tax=Timema bartmani TaxID=61472 RepID=A0A7R9EYY4_9NEOP|nr:unnamed protein product [Timema bartmani]